ncbi:MAG: Crp/Fnr family transcriptional regulator [Prevotella sp.]
MKIPDLHNRLLELPLFQGMSRNDIDEAISEIKPRPLSYSRNKVIISESDVCDKLFFLLRGTMTSVCFSDDRGYSVSEKLHAPNIIEPERIFGLTQRYTRTYKAAEECDFICISKMDMLYLADKYEIFRLNLLNIICTRSQRLARMVWNVKPQDIRSEITRFIASRCVRPAGEKTIAITMERLASEISESRLNVSRELNAMHKEGIITLRRSEIHVSALEKML